MTGFSKIFTDLDLLKRWRSQTNVSINEAVKHGLRCFIKDGSGKLTGCSYEELLRMRSTQRALQTRTGGWVQTGRPQQRVKKLRLYFYESDVEEFEAKHGIIRDMDALEGRKSGDGSVKSLTANAMLKQPVFVETIQAMGELVGYILENSDPKLPTEGEGYDFYLKKHKSLTKRVFDEIWRNIPKDLRRGRGERNR